MDAIEKLCRHVAETQFEDLPEAAVHATRVYVLDTIGVGIAGSAGPWVPELIDVARGLGASDEARVWARGDRLPAPGAAMCNAYQIHNSEFDCIHEEAVVHPMAVLLSATMAWIERAAQREGRTVTGSELIAAVALGVDLACHVGVASRAPLRFFRPATAGGLAATAAIGKLRGFDRDTLVNAMGICYSQACGTMQAHTEGSPVLGMQIGFNARNAITACDMSASGIPGPRSVLEGQFGFFALFEGEHDIERVLARLGRVWRISEVAHKPFPSGRATHGIVDACLELKRTHGFDAGDIERVVAHVPPLTFRLIGRPVTRDMTPNYARLSGSYVAARALLGDTVGIEDFTPDALRDAAALALGSRIEVLADDNPDPNALSPITVEIGLEGGTAYEMRVDLIYGNPAKPMSRDAYLDKFRRNWRASAVPLNESAGESLIEQLEALERVPDVRALVECMVGTPGGGAD